MDNQLKQLPSVNRTISGGVDQCKPQTADRHAASADSRTAGYSHAPERAALTRGKRRGKSVTIIPRFCQQVCPLTTAARY